MNCGTSFSHLFLCTIFQFLLSTSVELASDEKCGFVSCIFGRVVPPLPTSMGMVFVFLRESTSDLFFSVPILDVTTFYNLCQIQTKE